MIVSDSDSDTREVWSVSRLTAEARILLESAFGTVWVEGELSNVARPSSGHLYFTLKDSEAQVRCALFRQRGQRLRFRPEEGQQVLVRGRVSLYQARGDFQLIVDHMEPAGDGALRLAFEALKRRLDEEGLFAGPRQPLPRLPRGIAVVTSPTGAAIRDILTTLRRRFPAIPVFLYPAAVQGEGAAEQIAMAIATADRRRDGDVLIVARGGGSLEDLWAFNEEVVARAIHACEMPVVTGIGHEVDITIADLVADHRAATPTAAAEQVSPDREEWLAALASLRARLVRRARHDLRQAEKRLSWLGGRLHTVHPGRRLRDRVQRLDDLEQRLGLAWQLRHHAADGQLARAVARLHHHDPRTVIAQLADRRAHLAHRLAGAAQRAVREKRGALQSLARALDAVSPLATLQRGYAVVTREEGGAVVRRWNEVELGDRIIARLSRGRLRCVVEAGCDDTGEQSVPGPHPSSSVKRPG